MVEGLERQCFDLLESYLPQWAALGHQLANIAELGYTEQRTGQRVALVLKALGIEPQVGLAVSGIRAELAAAHSGPTVALLADMDALHPGYIDGNHGLTAPFHACGHFQQLVIMLAVMSVLVKSGIMEQLSGSVIFWATPAEEVSDPVARMRLMRTNSIGFMTGKMELRDRGAFDDVDLALAVHAGTGSTATVGASGQASLFKWIRRQPWDGAKHSDLIITNALWSVIHRCLQRYELEYRALDYQRVREGEGILGLWLAHDNHQILATANAALNEALFVQAAHYKTGIIINDEPLYFPFGDFHPLSKMFACCMERITGVPTSLNPIKGFSDLGSIAVNVPVSVLWTTGFTGALHHCDFRLSDPRKAYLEPSKAILATIVDLLRDDAKQARKIAASYRAPFSLDDYHRFLQCIQR